MPTRPPRPRRPRSRAPGPDRRRLYPRSRGGPRRVVRYAPFRLLRPLTLHCTRKRGVAEGEGAQQTIGLIGLEGVGQLVGVRLDVLKGTTGHGVSPRVLGSGWAHGRQRWLRHRAGPRRPGCGVGPIGVVPGEQRRGGRRRSPLSAAGAVAPSAAATRCRRRGPRPWRRRPICPPSPWRRRRGPGGPRGS